MGKRIQLEPTMTGPDGISFGERLASLRKAAGFTQVELAAELGISQRMVAYYETPTATPLANLLPQIAAALGVSIDELFGVAKRKLVKQEGDSRLRRRLLAIEKLDLADKPPGSPTPGCLHRAQPAQAQVRESSLISPTSNNKGPRSGPLFH